MPHLSEDILHTTVRIESKNATGEVSYGTGFFFAFPVGAPDENKIVVAIATNRHVLEHQSQLSFNFTLCDASGKPRYGSVEQVSVATNNMCFFHPDPEVDLAIYVAGPLLNTLKESGKPVYFKTASLSDLPTSELIQSLTAFEEVLMVGYPNSLWDSTNNLPIMRRGYTATPYALNYEGREEFMIDAACFPGSSGSPIYLYNPSSYSTSAGGIVIGSRFAFLGVLYAGPTYDVEGEIVVQAVPSTVQASSVSTLMLHLGNCIKSECLRAFLPIINALVAAEGNK